MRVGLRLGSGSVVEAAATLAAAVLMTVAGFEMLQGATTAPAHEIARPAASAHLAALRPHVDEEHA